MIPDAASTTSAFPLGSPESGPVLNGYRVVEPLGVAFSNCYKVRRESDQELFVAKVFTGLTSAQAQTLQHNCEQAFLLSHPRLIPVTGTGKSGEYFYILSEYTSGDSLAACLERWRRLPYPQTLDMITALAQAMAYAHMHGMHHGSLDPRKIMVLERMSSNDDQLRIGPDRTPDTLALFDPVNVKILGMGLGLPMSAFAPGDVRTLPVTQLAAQLYAAPERIVADLETAPPPTEWSDIYSLGCIFYQLLSGELPLPAADQNALRLMQQSETASLEPLRAVEVPEKARALIGHMIDRDASVRPSTYDALLEALSQLHGEYHDKIARTEAKPRRGGTSSIRLNPVREATALLAAPPLPEAPYRTHFARRTQRPWGRYLAVALLSSVATAGGIAAGLFILHQNQAATNPAPLTQGPNHGGTLSQVGGNGGNGANTTGGTATVSAADSEREAQAQLKYTEICTVLDKISDNELPVAITKLQEFKLAYAGTQAASRAEERCDILQKKLVLALAQKPQMAPPPVVLTAANDPRLVQWETRRKQALELAAALHFDQALQRVDPKQLPQELQTTEVMKSAADAWADISADVGRHWAETEQNVATLLVQKQYDPALLQVDLVIKTWGVDEYIQRAQQLRAKIAAAQDMETERLKAEGLDKQRAREAGDWAQQLYILNVQAKKFQYDTALTTAKTFRGLDLKNDVVKNEVDEEIEILALQKELLKRINQRLDKVKLSIEWKNQRLRIMEINEKGVKGRTPENDPDPKNPGQGVAYITVVWANISLPTVYNNLYAYLIDTYQADEHMMLAVFAHQHSLVEYEDEAAVAAQFGDAAAQKVARLRGMLQRLDARLKQATPPADSATHGLPGVGEPVPAPVTPAPVPGVPPAKPAAPATPSTDDPGITGGPMNRPNTEGSNAGVLPQP